MTPENANKPQLTRETLMEIRRHARIQAIRKVSGYFLIALTFSRAVIPILGCIFVGLILFASDSTSSFHDFFLQYAQSKQSIFDLIADGVSLEIKLVFILLISLLFFVMEMIVIYLRKLIACFYEGNIFHHAAISYATKAFNWNLALTAVILALELCLSLMNMIYGTENPSLSMSTWIGNVVDEAIWIGCLLLIIWSLEIGVDLNEEAELTI
ncbi:hypothetical protein ACO0LB_08480 [Undibacterium sp. SXout7W]|uniref:hypothetical protein n=1 Tax=Undibacterium sp. SXout7W TaxID=3413049 RepID=UPI003BF035B2